jgi:hypothetical protein
VEVGNAIPTATGSLLGGSSVSLPQTVNIGTTITGFKVSLNQYWGLTYSGCVSPATGNSGQSFDYQGSVKLQWADAQNGPWHTLATTGGLSIRSCGIGGVAFSGTATAAKNYAYYRAYYPAVQATSTVPGDGGTGYLSSASGAVLAWKYADRITGFSVSPTTVSRNGKITVRGQLQYWNNNAWHDYSGQIIYIIFHDPNFCQSGTGWCYMVKVKTNSSGKFSATFSDFIDSAPWAAAYEGNSTHLSAGSPNTVYVKVR